MAKKHRSRNGSKGTGISCRGFLKAAGAFSAAYWLGPKLIIGGKVYAEAIPGGTLPPGDVLKYQTPMLIPPALPKAAVIKMPSGKNADYYEIPTRQFRQKILPASFYATLGGEQADGTLVWGYGAVAVDPKSKDGQLFLNVHNAPSLTIEARAGTSVRIKWINDLKDATGNYLPHLLPVDQTLHWANPPGDIVGRDTRPTFGSTPGAYIGPVPIVTHVPAPSGSATRAMGIPRHGTCRMRAISTPVTQEWAPGTTFSPTKPSRALALSGAPDTLHSNIQTSVWPRPTGITTTLWV